MLLLDIHAKTTSIACSDSVRQCVDSIMAVYIRNLSANVQHADNSFLSNSNIITLIVFIVGLLGSWLLFAYKVGVFTTTIKTIENSIKDLKLDTAKIPNLEVKINTMWGERYSQSNSPMVLNLKGQEVLKSSGIDKIVENNYTEILEKVKLKSPKNAYEAQEQVKDSITELLLNPILKNELEISAFKAGVDVLAILFIGSLYIRDRVLSDIGFSLDDIDKHDPDNPKNTAA